MSSIQKYDDGKYRWAYELNMYRNPSILITVLKVITVSFAAIWLFSCLLSMGSSRFWWDGFLDTTRVFALLIAAFWVIGYLAYLLVAVTYGGRYCVLFEMDEDGIRHTQMAKQVKKAEMLGMLTVLVGAAAKKPGTVGSGLLAASKTSIYTEFSKVKSIKAYPRRNLIKVNASFSKNQVYTEPEDFDFVYEYISSRVPLQR